VEDGEIAFGDAPGLGIELNEALIERRRLAGRLHIRDGESSDMMFGRDYLPSCAVSGERGPEYVSRGRSPFVKLRVDRRGHAERPK